MRYTGRIYHIVQKIPDGKVTTYGQIAELLGNKGLARIVGNELHKNPNGEKVPCYKVVNSEGRLAPHFVFGGDQEQKKRLEKDKIHVKQIGQQYYVDLKEYKWDGRIPYHSLNNYLKKEYGRKIYKISIDAGFTCPNRDGKIGTGGCIFCSGKGSGDFAKFANMTINQQINYGKSLVGSKMTDSEEDRKYIAYFQAFTNTYAPVEKLELKYKEALEREDIVAISIATRPDCISIEVVNLITKLKELYKKDIWIELGLQTIKKETAEYIRRGYPLHIYDEAMELLEKAGIKTVTHVILGLPNETREEMLQTVEYACNSGTWGIKLQLLHVIAGTDLEKDYDAGLVKELEFGEYINLVRECLALMPPEIVVHRLTGDGDKNTLRAPMWSADKKRVLNAIQTIAFPI